MALVLKTANSGKVVTREEAKRHTLIDGTEDDPMIDALLTTAVKYVEKYISRQLLTATWQLYFDGFPREIQLPRSPIKSVASITYVDSAGVSQTLSALLYQTDFKTEPGRIRPAYNEVWPTPRTQTLNAVVVEYVAGYGDEGSDVPEEIKTAIKMLVTHWFRNRETVSLIAGANITKVPVTVDALLANFRIGAFG